MTTNIRRAWSGVCVDGNLRDTFANAIAHRIGEENHDSEVAGYPPELVEDFAEKCDAIFAEHNPKTGDEVESLAASIDTNGLFDLVGE